MKNLKIWDCRQCMHSMYLSHFDESMTCDLAHSSLPTFADGENLDIPDWCPLEEAEPKEISHDAAMS